MWLDKAFSLIKECPRYLVPCYFDAIITPLYLKLLDRAWSQMSRFANIVVFFVRTTSKRVFKLVSPCKIVSFSVILDFGINSGRSETQAYP